MSITDKKEKAFGKSVLSNGKVGSLRNEGERQKNESDFLEHQNIGTDVKIIQRAGMKTNDSNEELVSLDSPKRKTRQLDPFPLNVDNEEQKTEIRGMVSPRVISPHNDRAGQESLLQSEQVCVESAMQITESKNLANLREFKSPLRSPPGLIRPIQPNSPRKHNRSDWKKLQLQVVPRNSNSINDFVSNMNGELQTGKRNKQGLVEVRKMPGAKVRQHRASMLNNTEGTIELQVKLINAEKQHQLNPIYVNQTSQPLSPVANRDLKPLTTRGSHLAGLYPPNTRGSATGSMDASSLSPSRGVKVQELNVSTEDKRQITTNWQKCRGMHPQSIKNKWALEMQKKAQQIKKKQQGQSELDMKNHLEAIQKYRLKQKQQIEDMQKQQQEHKLAMMRVLSDAADICEDGSQEGHKKKRHKVKKSKKRVNSSKESLTERSIDLMLKDKNEELQKLTINTDLSKIPETENSETTHEQSISFSVQGSTVTDHVNELKMQIDMLEQLNRIKSLPADSIINIKRIGSPQIAVDQEKTSAPAGPMINLQVTASQVLQTQALRDEMKAIEDVVQKQGLKVATLAQNNEGSKYLQPAGPSVKYALKGTKMRTQQQSKRNQQMYYGRKSMEESKAPNLIPTNQYLINVTGLTPDEQLNMLKKRVEILWNQIIKVEEQRSKKMMDTQTPKKGRVILKDNNVSSVFQSEQQNDSKVALTSLEIDPPNQDLGHIQEQHEKNGLKEIMLPEKIHIKSTSKDQPKPYQVKQIEPQRMTFQKNHIGNSHYMKVSQYKKQDSVDIADSAQKINQTLLQIQQLKIKPQGLQVPTTQEKNFYKMECPPIPQPHTTKNLNPQTVFPFSPINSQHRSRNNKKMEKNDTLYIQSSHSANRNNTMTLSPKGGNQIVLKQKPLQVPTTATQIQKPNFLRQKKYTMNNLKQDQDIETAFAKGSMLSTTRQKNPISQRNSRESSQEKGSLTGYKPSLPSKSNMRIQYDIDEFMKNATQYLKKSNQFPTGGGIQDKLSQQDRTSSNRNVDIKSFIDRSGESFNFRKLWNMPFTPPTADAIHQRRKLLSVHMPLDSSQPAANMPIDSQQEEANTYANALPVLDQFKFNLDDTVRNGGTPPGDESTRQQAKNKSMMSPNQRNNEMYKIIKKNKDSLRKTQKNLDKPDNLRKVALIKKPQEQPQTDYIHQALRQSQFSNSSDVPSSSYQPMSPYLTASQAMVDSHMSPQIQKGRPEINSGQVKLPVRNSIQQPQPQFNQTQNLPNLYDNNESMRSSIMNQLKQQPQKKYAGGTNYYQVYDEQSNLREQEGTPFLGHKKLQNNRLQISVDASSIQTQFQHSPDPPTMTDTSPKTQIKLNQTELNFVEPGSGNFDPGNNFMDTGQIISYVLKNAIPNSHESQERSPIDLAAGNNSQEFCFRKTVDSHDTIMLPGDIQYSVYPMQQVNSNPFPEQILISQSNAASTGQAGEQAQPLQQFHEDNRDQVKISRLKELERQFKQKLKDKSKKLRIEDIKTPPRLVKKTQRDLKSNGAVFKDKSVERIRQQLNNSGIKIDNFPHFQQKLSNLPEISKNSQFNNKVTKRELTDNEMNRYQNLILNQLAQSTLPKDPMASNQQLIGYNDLQYFASGPFTPKAKDIKIMNHMGFPGNRVDISPQQTSRHLQTEGTLEFNVEKAYSKQELMNDLSSNLFVKQQCERSQQANMSNTTSKEGLQQIVQSAVQQAQSTLQQEILKRQGSVEVRRENSIKIDSPEKGFLTEHSIDSIQQSLDGLNGISRHEKDDLKQKSVLLTQSIDSAVIPQNLGTIKTFNAEELAEFAKLQNSTCLLNNRNKQDLNAQISKMMMKDQSHDQQNLEFLNITNENLMHYHGMMGLDVMDKPMVQFSDANKIASQKLKSRRIGGAYQPYKKRYSKIYRSKEKSKESKKERKEVAQFIQNSLLLEDTV